MNEQRLVKRCKTFDRDAQQQLYEQFAPHVFAVILRYVPDEDDAKDVLQDTMLKAFDSIGQFTWRGEGSLRSWLGKIAVNTALNHLRHQKTWADKAVHVDEMPDEAEPQAEDVEQIDAATLMRMIGELPEGYRTVFNLFCIEGMTHRQIAEHLGIEEKSSSSQLARAKALLAKKIKDYLKERQND